MTLQKLPLSNLGEWGSGGTPLVSKSEYYGRGFPWLIIEDLNDGYVEKAARSITPLGLENSSAKLVPTATVLIAMYGSIGKLGITRMSCATNQAIAFCKCNPQKVTPKFLFYLLLFNRNFFIHAGRGGTQQNINQEFLKDFEVCIPPLDEQNRIVDLLDETDRLRRLRRYVLELSDFFLQSIFVEMFGDPVVNEKNWDIEKFEDVGVLDRGRSKHRPRDAAHLYGGKYPFIQTGDIANCDDYILAYKQSYSDAGLKQSRLWDAGVLCITIAANIAKTGILTYPACFPDSVVGFIPNGSVRTEYVQYWLKFLQQILERTAPESAQKNINLEILRELKIPVPPIPIQDRFVGIVKKHRHVRVVQKESLRQAEHLFQTLLHEAFSNA